MIFHVAIESEWQQAIESGFYLRSTREKSLQEVGFIHASYREQVAKVANRVHADQTEPLVLLTIDPDLVGSSVLPEGRDEDYPHIYGPLPVGAVVDVTPYLRGSDGTYPAL